MVHRMVEFFQAMTKCFLGTVQKIQMLNFLSPSLTINFFQSSNLTIETWQLKFFGQQQLFFSHLI
jgi:hypothetical protein